MNEEKREEFLQRRRKKHGTVPFVQAFLQIGRRLYTVQPQPEMSVFHEFTVNHIIFIQPVRHAREVPESEPEFLHFLLKLWLQPLLQHRLQLPHQRQDHQGSPFEMSLDISNWTDAVICDYNYVFDPNVRLKRYFSEGVKGEYLFLIDEAHNLVERGREMFSASLCK